MVVDSSALLTILFQEDGAATYEVALAEADDPIISAASLLEASMVVEGRGGIEAVRDLDELIATAGIRSDPS